MSTITALPELNPWGELPVWAALLINTTARGLALPDRWQGWEWSERDSDLIIVHSNGHRFMVRRGASWVV